MAQSSESQSTPASSPNSDDAILDCNTFPGEHSSPYPCPSFYSFHKLTPLAFETNLSLETLSLGRASVPNSPLNSPSSTSSRKFSFSSELGDIHQETIYSCTSLREPTEIARPSSDNNTLIGDPFLENPHKGNFLEHKPRDEDTCRNYSSEFYPHPHPLLLSQPDGNNTWTLSLDPTISRPETISESSHELESLSLTSSCAPGDDDDDEAIARIQGTLPSVCSTPRYDSSFPSLPRLQVGAHDIAEFTAGSDVSMIVSSTSSIQQRHGEGTVSFPFSKGDIDLHPNSHNFPLSTVQDSALDPQQRNRSNNLVKKSKDIFGRLKRLFTPKGTTPKDTQTHITYLPKSVAVKNAPSPMDSIAQADTKSPALGRLLSPPSWRPRLLSSTKSSTPSFGHSFSPEDTSHTGSNINEKYTYEYHARPKTLKEIKSQRRFSLPMAFTGTSSRVTPSTKRNLMTPVPRSQSRPMSMYIPSQSETLDCAA